MTAFVPGLELSQDPYHELVRPILDADFPGLPYFSVADSRCWGSTTRCRPTTTGRLGHPAYVTPACTHDRGGRLLGGAEPTNPPRRRGGQTPCDGDDVDGVNVADVKP